MEQGSLLHVALTLGVFTGLWVGVYIFFRNQLQFSLLHSCVAFCSSLLAIAGFVPMYHNIGLTCGFFIADFPFSKRDENIHHVIGTVYGVLAMCDVYLPDVYVWLQTNEVSTIFLNVYNLSGRTQEWAGYMFALTFFVSRVVINNFITFPVSYSLIPGWIWWPAVSYQAIQMYWFYFIVKRLLRHVDPKKAEQKEDSKLDPTALANAHPGAVAHVKIQGC